MQIHIITIFPKMFAGPFEESIVKRAQDKGIVKIFLHNLRKWTTDKHQSVDGRPFGGGPGMVMMVEPIYKAVKEIRSELKGSTKVILTSAKGEIHNQGKARELSKLDNLIIICGHYEGVDERVADFIADEEISIGKYVLTGGEIPTMVIVDSVVRLIPGVVGNEESIETESFSNGSDVEYPQYTRPAEFQTEEGEKWSVPDVLLKGNHAEIEKWRGK